MKPCSKFLLTALIAGFELILGGQMTAQTLTTLHSFTILSNNTNCDGAGPNAVLVFSDNILYGTANFGGSSGNGAVFRLNTDGTGFKNLHSFTTNSDPLYTNSDGALPYAGVTLSGKILYGTAEAGGSSGNGTVFAVNTDGTGFTNLHSFTGDGGSNPYAGLILSGGTLCGTARFGSSSAPGMVFTLNTDGTGFTNL